MLAGTQAYGNPSDMSKGWGTKFSNTDFNEFLFATGDVSMWMIMERDEVLDS